MADPKIRYDIGATVTGDAEINKLAAELEKLDSALDPALAERAKLTAQRLRELGEQGAAVDQFVRIKQASEAAAAGLDQAQAQAQAFARELSAVAAPTRAQAGQFEKLKDEVTAAKLALQTQTNALDASRGALTALGIPTEGLAQKQSELKRELASTSTELRQIGAQASSVQAFATLARQTETARDALARAEQGLSDYRATLSSTAQPTQAQTTNLGRLAAAAQDAQLAFQRASAAQAASATQLRGAGVDVDRIAAAQRQAAAATNATADASRAAAAAAALQGRTFVTAANQQVQAAGNVREQVAGIGRQLQTLQSLAAAAIGGQFLGGMAADLGRTADEYTNLAARIKLVTGEGAAFDAAFEGVFDVATRTNSTLESTGTLFARLAAAGKSIGVTSQQALALTESINQAVQISGTSAQGSDAAIQQLIQGLQSGVLRGEEFNSVMEQAPRLATALADGLGVTTGELRKLAEAGQLTSTTVIQALQGQSAALQREFETLPPTIGRALTNLTTEWTRYVGEADKANGISAAAARALQALASNLDTVAAALIGVGKAVLAYQALKLAQSFASAGAAATAAATQIATIGPAMTTAATSSAAAATNMGRFAGILSGLKTFSLIGLLTNLPAIGAALGEGIAKLAGYRDRMDEVEAADKRAAEAGQRLAQEKAALAQQLKHTAEQALGLTGRSRELVAEFDGLRTKGENAADALAKIGKSLDLTGLQGIRDAAAALDALAVQGKITGTQMREALAGALNGQDLAVFATQAQAAFDGSEQGARRLAASIAAVDSEALRRAGTSAEELQTGFSRAAISAINDVDALVTSLDALGVKGGESSVILSNSLDKAISAANTEKAVQALIDRLNQLGVAGKLSGDQVEQGLEKARKKIEAIKPVTDENKKAIQDFGLKTNDELQKVADRYAKSWESIKNSTTLSLSEKVKAFEKYKTAAIDANNGVVPSEVRVQEGLLRTKQRAEELAGGFDEAGRSGARNFDLISAHVSQTAAAIDGVAERNRKLGAEIAASDAARQTINRTASDNTAFFTLQDKQRTGRLSAGDLAQAEMVAQITRSNTVAGIESGAFDLQGRRSAERDTATADAILETVRNLALVEKNKSATPAQPRGTISTDSNGQRVTTPAASSNHTVNINFEGRTRTINTASANDSANLSALLKDLASAKSVAQ